MSHALPQSDAKAPQAERRAEAGYMLVAVVVMAALVLIALAVAAPVVARDLQREKEVESARRAQEYVRAIQLYQRACRCTSYPASMEALEKSTTVRFLRERWVDPLTGKSDWRLIHNPQTTIKGFFGQDLAGLSGGLGSAAGLASGVGSMIGSPPGPGGTSTIGSTSPLASGFSGATVGAPTTGATGAPGATGTAGAGGASGGTGSTGSGGTGMFGDSSGGVIYGVGPNKTGSSIITPNGQSTYETWEFWYDPRIELLKANVQLLGGGGPAGASSSGTSSGPTSTDAASFGQSIGGQSNAPAGAAGASGAGGATGTTGATGATGTTQPQ